MRSLINSMSKFPLGSEHQHSNLYEQELSEQEIQERVKAIKEKLEQKHAVVSENKAKIAKRIATKSQRKLSQVETVRSQKIVAVTVLREKLKAKHALAAANKKKMLKSVSEKYSLKKDKITMSTISYLIDIQSIEAKSDINMEAVAMQRNSIIAGIVEKLAETNRKIILVRDKVQADRLRKVKKIEVLLEKKLVGAIRKKNSMLLDFTNASLNSTERARASAWQRACLEHNTRSKHELKLKSAEKRRNAMLELENEKRRVKRIKRENIRKMMMLSRPQKPKKDDALQSAVELMTLVKERNEREEKGFYYKRSNSLGTATTVSDSFEWEDDETSYSGSFTDQLETDDALYDVELDTEDNKRPPEHMPEGFAETMTLSDIQVMQSIVLAEEAAQHGKDKFKTVEKLTELDTVEISFSTGGTSTSFPPTSSQECKQKRGRRPVIMVSKRVATLVTSRLSNASRRAKPALASRIGGFTDRVKEIKRAAVVVDRRRHERRALLKRQIRIR